MWGECGLTASGKAVTMDRDVDADRRDGIPAHQARPQISGVGGVLKNGKARAVHVYLNPEP
jgi:hypothetical protein